MEPEDAVEFVQSLAREHRRRDVDLVLQRSEHLAVRIFRGRVEKLDQATGQGLGIRVVDEGRTGIAYTERLEPKALEKAFLAAKENSTLQDPTEVELLSPPDDVPDPAALELYNPDLESIGVADLEALGLEIEARALKADPRVTSVSRLSVFRAASEYRVVSMHGVDYAQRSNSVGAMCQALLEDGERRKSGGYYWSQRYWDPETAAAIGDEAVGRGAGLLGAEPATGGHFPVVLDEYCAPDLLSFYLGAHSSSGILPPRSRWTFPRSFFSVMRRSVMRRPLFRLNECTHKNRVQTTRSHG